jgi:hypothetical protein
MAVANFSETIILVCQSALRHIPEKWNIFHSSLTSLKMATENCPARWHLRLYTNAHGIMPYDNEIFGTSSCPHIHILACIKMSLILLLLSVGQHLKKQPARKSCYLPVIKQARWLQQVT